MQLARPLKDGVDYFPFDVTLDEKFDLIEAEFGLTGFAVVVKLYQRVYARGYYCEWTDEVALLFGKSISLGGNAVSEIVNAAVKRGIFDKNMFDKYQILTSKGIQGRYFEAVIRRKCVNVNKAYLLIDVTKILPNAHIIWINDNINPENADNNSQSKGKKSKLNKSKRNDITGIADFYESNIGLMPRYVTEEVQCYMDDGIESDLIIETLKIAVSNNVRKWSYAAAILKDCRNKNIKTLKDFIAERKEEPSDGNGTFKHDKDRNIPDVPSKKTLGTVV